MFINTTAMAHHHYGLLAWGIEHKFPGAFDQDMIRGYFALDDLDQLNETFNWKVRGTCCLSAQPMASLMAVPAHRSAPGGCAGHHVAMLPALGGALAVAAV
jgi:hypothetical protein